MENGNFVILTSIYDLQEDAFYEEGYSLDGFEEIIVTECTT